MAWPIYFLYDLKNKILLLKILYVQKFCRKMPVFSEISYSKNQEYYCNKYILMFSYFTGY